MKIATAKLCGLLLLTGLLSACNSLVPSVKGFENDITAKINAHQEKAQEPVQVVSSTPSAWLAGAAVEIGEPVLPVLNTEVSWHPAMAITLADAAAYIYKKTGLVVDIAELQSGSATGSFTGKTASSSSNMPVLGGMGQGAGGGMSPPIPPGVPIAQTGFGGNAVGGYPQQQSMYSMYINYEGKLSGLLDFLANKTSSWWKIANGRAVLYRSETKTFYLPALPKKVLTTSTISTTSSSVNSAGGGAGTNTVSTGMASTAGANIVSTYDTKMWEDIKVTAEAVGAGATVAVNPTSGSITVTGTPSQVRNIEHWARDLANQLSQQVAITVKLYSVKVTKGNNYNWEPKVIFRAKSGVFGFNMNGPQAPAVLSGTTPFGVALSAASNALSGNTTQYNGSEMAFKALSSLGSVNEQISQTVVAMNNQATPIQIANQKGYLAQSATTTTPNVGATSSLIQGMLTTGFTVMFLPRIVNGKVILGMTMTNSTDNGFEKVESNGGALQNPNVDANNFENSVSLTPGDALMLTGLQRDTGRASRNGVGSPNNFLLGGGVDESTGKQMLAIVITAEIL